MIKKRDEKGRILPLTKEERKISKEKRIIYFKGWCEKNKEKVREYDKKRQLSGKVLEYRRKFRERYRKYHKLWRDKNKDKILIYSRKHRSRPEIRALGAIRARLIRALKVQHTWKSGKTIELLGCSIPELKKYLEGRFKEKMNWGNYGKYSWHIDHIKPLASFDLSNLKQQKIASHYTNLQPLWAFENLSKGKKYGN